MHGFEYLPGGATMMHCAPARLAARWGMANEKEIVTCLGDESFRKGACHGAHWFLETSQTLAQQGRSGGEISAHLTDLAGVLTAWRNQTEDLPDGNPWDWSFKDLAAVIKAGKES